MQLTAHQSSTVPFHSPVPHERTDCLHTQKSGHLCMTAQGTRRGNSATRAIWLSIAALIASAVSSALTSTLAPLGQSSNRYYRISDAQQAEPTLETEQDSIDTNSDLDLLMIRFGRPLNHPSATTFNNIKPMPYRLDQLWASHGQNDAKADLAIERMGAGRRRTDLFGFSQPSDFTTAVLSIEESGFPFRCFRGTILIKGSDRQFASAIDIASPTGTEPTRLLPLAPIWLGLLANILIYATIFWIILLSYGLCVRHIAIRKHRCVLCGYLLSNLTDHGCPECGWERQRIQ